MGAKKKNILLESKPPRIYNLLRLLAHGCHWILGSATSQYLLTIIFSMLYIISCFLVPLGIILTGHLPAFSFDKEGPAIFTIGYAFFAFVVGLGVASPRFALFTSVLFRSFAKRPLRLHTVHSMLLTLFSPVTALLGFLYAAKKASHVAEAPPILALWFEVTYFYSFGLLTSLLNGLFHMRYQSTNLDSPLVAGELARRSSTRLEKGQLFEGLMDLRRACHMASGSLRSSGYESPVINQVIKSLSVTEDLDAQLHTGPLLLLAGAFGNLPDWELTIKKLQDLFTIDAVQKRAIRLPPELAWTGVVQQLRPQRTRVFRLIFDALVAIGTIATAFLTAFQESVKGAVQILSQQIAPQIATVSTIATALAILFLYPCYRRWTKAWGTVCWPLADYMASLHTWILSIAKRRSSPQI